MERLSCFLLSVITLVYCERKYGSSKDILAPIRLTRAPLGSFVRDFVVFVTSHHNSHPWNLPFLFDTGSWENWVLSDTVAMSRGDGLRAYIDAHGTARDFGPRTLTYGYGHSIQLDYALDETISVGPKANATILLWISTRLSPAFGISFGSVGTLGAELSSDLARQIGMFTFIPRNGRMEMRFGPFKDREYCRTKAIQYTMIRRIGGSYDRWNVEGSIGVRSQIPRLISVPEKGVAMMTQMLMDTGMPGVELFVPLFNAFASIMLEIGSPIREMNGMFFAKNCGGYMHRFPVISLVIGTFSHYIRPRAYVVYRGSSECSLRIYRRETYQSIPQMVVGSNFLRYVISHWDVENLRMGFCSIR